MPYTQKEYESEIAETTPGKSSLLVSFSNLLERFQKDINPVDLDKAFQSLGITEAMPGSISIYYPELQITAFGESGTPPRDDAIMRFEYESPVDNSHVVHYCLVEDALKGTIIDSYSGIEKSWDIYGGPGAWASYMSSEEVKDMNVPDVPIVAVNDTTQPVAKDDDSVSIPVRVTPPNPFKKWQDTYVSQLGTVNYIATGHKIVRDLTGQLPDKIIAQGMIVPIAGTFEKDGEKYYRTSKSAVAGSWYGIPVDFLSKQGDMSDDELDSFFMGDDSDLKEPKQLNTHEKFIKGGATIKGKLDKLLSFGKK